jgi:hypothetical protein
VSEYDKSKWQKYYAAHREEKAVRNRAYRETHRAEMAASQKKWRETHRAEVAAACKKWRKENREKVAARRKRWYEAHREEIAAKNKKWYEEKKMDMKKRRLIDRLVELNPSPKRGVAGVIAREWDEIKEALDAGYTARSIWRLMTKDGTVKVGYGRFIQAIADIGQEKTPLKKVAKKVAVCEAGAIATEEKNADKLLEKMKDTINLAALATLAPIDGDKNLAAAQPTPVDCRVCEAGAIESNAEEATAQKGDKNYV